MAQTGPPVNQMAGGNPSAARRFREWVDCHPRTGWYLVVLLFINYVLDLAQSLL